jgi:hypothetical protein
MRIQFRIKAGDAEKRERRGERVGGGVELTGKCYAGSVLCRLLTPTLVYVTYAWIMIGEDARGRKNAKKILVRVDGASVILYSGCLSGRLDDLLSGAYLNFRDY